MVASAFARNIAAALLNQYVFANAVSPLVSIGAGSNQSIINKEILIAENKGDE